MQGNLIHRLAYNGQVGQIYGMWIVNIFLTILTFGIYSFWGKSRMRRYLTGSLSIDGHSFEYTGTGGELFRGFLKALPIVIIVYALLIGAFLMSKMPEIKVYGYVLMGVTFSVIFFLSFAGFFWSLRYKASRVNFMGIRPKLEGSAFTYALIHIGAFLLQAISLGIATPYVDMKTHGYLIRNFYWGKTNYIFTPTPAKLMGINIITLLLFVPTIGLSRLWYHAALIRHIAESTQLGSLRFQNDSTGKDLLGLILGNLFILVCTLGLGIPFIYHRSMKFVSKHMTIVGDMTALQFVQSDEKLKSSGEGIETIFGG